MEIPKKELEDIIDQKVEKRLGKRKQRTGREAEIRTETPDEESDPSLSRRGFLKAAGVGVAGIGAAAMIGNASAFRINSDQGLKYYNSSTAKKSQFNVSPDGVLNVDQIGTKNKPVNSIHSKTTTTGELYDKDNPVTARITQYNGTVYASGREKQIASDSDAMVVANAAIDAVPDEGHAGTGQKITFTRGKFSGNGSYSLNETRVEGEGMRATVLTADDGTTNDIVEYHPTDTADDRDFFTGLHNLKVDGNKSGGVVGNGIHSLHSGTTEPNDWHMSRVFCHNCESHGAFFENHWGYHIDHCLYENNNQAGMRFKNGSQAYISDIFSAYNDQQGIRISQSPKMQMVNIHCYQNGEEGLKVGGASNSTISNIIAWNNGQLVNAKAGIEIVSDNITVSNISVFDSQSPPTQSYGLRLDSCNNVIVTNAILAGNKYGDLHVAGTVTDATFQNVYYEDFTDDGVRTIINGSATNNGDPNTQGDWNNHAKRASKFDATVWDISTSTPTPYKAHPDTGSGFGWIAI